MFQILNIPYASSFVLRDGMGTAGFGSGDTNTDRSLDSFYTIKSEIETYLATLSPAMETAVTSLVAQWDAIDLAVTRINGGAVGGIQGATYDPEDKRAEIRKRMENLVPYVQRYRVMERNAGARPTTVQVIR